MIYNYFDKVYIINLLDRYTKYENLLNILINLNFNSCDIIRTDAIDTRIPNIPYSGMMGCTKSHLKCYNNIINSSYNNCLIMEDDCIFHEDFVKLFSEYIEIIKNIEYGIIHFHNKNPYFRKNNRTFDTDSTLCLLKNTFKYGAHFYAVNKNFLITSNYIDYISKMKYPVDKAMYKYKKLCYRTNITLVAQYNFFSDISQKNIKKV